MINFSFQTIGVEVSVKSVNIPETSDSVVSFFFDVQVYLPLFNVLCYSIILTCVISSIIIAYSLENPDLCGTVV